MSEITYRPAREDDLERTYEVFVAATNDLAAAHNFPQVAGQKAPPARALAFRRHALALDGERFWVAETAGEVVGFGVGLLRGPVCYLAALHVLPAYQGRGIGKRLLALCVGPAHAPGARTWTTIADSLNPVSNAMYSRFGMYPWIPLLPFSGDVAGRDLGEPAVCGIPLDGGEYQSGVIDRVDAIAYGVPRPADHVLWGAQPGLAGYLLHDGVAPVGYAYVDQGGAIGPLAVMDEAALAPAIGFCLRRLREQGVDYISVKVPGVCRPALRYLLELELHLGTCMLLLASESFGRMSQYIPSGGDALL